MTDDRWQRIKDLFGEACELPTQLRRGFLDEACGGEPDVQQEVEALLEHHTGAELTDDDPEPEREGAGAMIDRYRLLEPIGEGGMGEVWMAEQLRPVKRKVALKIIKLGMDTAEVVARFEAERQALALMDHPHIAKVLDGGATEAGRPFFVMELVKGVPITEWCDEAELDTEGRLDLFRNVCHAVQHAHTRGIIHRDIKPSNVLVTLHDGVPVPKVIDFGIAKAIDQELTERTCFTRYRQVVGTPESMAPEQAEMSGLDVDARADIYSLGVLLYELLTGTKPFDPEQLREAGYLEMLRTIREVEPPKPSTRLTALGAALSGVAARRGAQPASLPRQLSGDIDWIVMKCLEKDRTRRYETAVALAEDVARHLACEPVEASPPSALYRFGKFARRRRGAVAAAALLVLGLGVGFVSAAVKYSRMHGEWEDSLREREVALAQRVAADEARRVADAERDRSERANRFFSDVLGGAEPAVAWTSSPAQLAPLPRGDVAVMDVAGMLDAAARRAEVEFDDDPELRARVGTVISRSFTRRGMWAEAQEFVPRAHAAAARELGEDDEWVIELSGEMTELLFESGQVDDAIANQARSVELLLRKHGDKNPEALAAASGLANMYLSEGRTEEAERVLRQVLVVRGDARGAPGVHGAPHEPSVEGVHVAAPHVFDGAHLAAAPRAPGAPHAVPRVAKLPRLQRVDQGDITTSVTLGGADFFHQISVSAGQQDGRLHLFGSEGEEDMVFATDGAQRVVLRSFDESQRDTVNVVERALVHERLEAALRPGALAKAKNAAAWALLTTPSEELRDVPLALELASAACEASGHADPALLDTLSLALFRSGRVDEAIANQREALDIVVPTRTLLIADMQRALAVFEGRLPEEQLHVANDDVR